MGDEVLDKFAVIPGRPGLLDEAPKHSPIPLARVNRTFKARPQMSVSCHERTKTNFTKPPGAVAQSPPFFR